MKGIARKAATVVATLGFAMFTIAASATVIPLKTWIDFNFSGIVGTDLTAGSFGAPPWTFDCPADHCKVVVTDGFLPIDQFQFFDFGVAIGTTSVPSGDATHSCFADPDACLADAQMSHGIFIVGGGAHSLTGILTMGDPALPGTAFFRVAVPEPGTLVLIGAGLLMLVGMRRRA